MDMDILELRYFLEVAKAGSFSRASTRLGLTQSALSRQIQKLERELCNGLFYRHGRGAVLTDAGRRLQDIVDPIVQQLSRLKKQMLEESSSVSGVVTLGIPPSIGRTMGASLVLQFKEICPNAQVRVYEAFCGSLVEWIEEDRLDVAVLYDARRNPNLIAAPLIKEDLFLVQSASSAPRLPRAAIQELKTTALVLPGLENGIRRVIDAAASAAKIDLTVTMEVDSVDMLKQLVEMEAGATILPFGAVYADVRDGRLVARPIDSLDMTALLVSATPLNRPVSLAGHSMLRLLCSEVRRCLKLGVMRGQLADIPTDPIQRETEQYALT
jgi:LysR family nitrogen assimilation transcriptional regulator